MQNEHEYGLPSTGRRLWPLVALPLLGAVDVARADVSIMPIGDSITEGTSSFGFSSDEYPESAYRNEPDGPPNDLRSYREHLHDLLTGDACGADVEWLGARRASGRSPAVHEGHGGWHASYFEEITWRDDNGARDGERDIGGWLREFGPDVVTLHLGTNGLGRSRTASQNVDDLRGILDRVFEADASTSVFLANVIPISGWWGDRATTLDGAGPTVREEAQLLTGLIGNLASEQAASGRDVVLVDVNSGFYVDESNPVDCPAGTGGDPNNMTMTVCVTDPTGESGSVPDGLHPNLRGDRFIAERFFDAMRSLPGVCDGSAPDPEPLPMPAPEPIPDETTEPDPVTEGGDGATPGTDEPTDPPTDERAEGEAVDPDDEAESADAADARNIAALLELLGNWRHARSATGR